MKINPLFTVLMLLNLSGIAQTKEIAFEKIDMQAALKKSKAEKKLVFVDCYTAWCGPCKNMEATVFRTDSVSSFLNDNLINIKIDMEKGEGPAVGKLYAVQAYPSYLILDAEGKMIYKFVGASSAAKFMSHIRNGIRPGNETAELNRRYDSGDRTPELLRKYVKYKIQVMEIKTAQTVNDELMTILSAEDKISPQNWFLFGQNRYTMYLSDLFSPNFNYLANHWRDFAKQNPRDTINSKLSSVYRKIVSYTLNGYYFKRQPYDKNTFEAYKAQIKDSEMPDKAQLLIMMDVAVASAEKNEVEVTDLLIRHLGGFSEDNKHILFDYLTYCSSIKGYRYPKIIEMTSEVEKTSKNPFLVNLFKGYKKRYATSTEN